MNVCAFRVDIGLISTVPINKWIVVWRVVAIGNRCRMCLLCVDVRLKIVIKLPDYKWKMHEINEGMWHACESVGEFVFLYIIM